MPRRFGASAARAIFFSTAGSLLSIEINKRSETHEETNAFCRGAFDPDFYRRLSHAAPADAL
jgi:hypothetical protein